MPKTHTRQFELEPAGLSSFCHPAIHALGRRGPREVFRVDSTAIQHAVDPTSGLLLVPIEEIFYSHISVIVGFGLPNTFTAIHTGAGWIKLAAYMCRRDPAHLADTKERMQAGVFFELCDLPVSARIAIWSSMNTAVGKKGISCARINAQMLARAGFTFGNGRSLNSVVRPTQFASQLWRYGLRYDGTPVRIRIVAGGEHGIGDHFVGVWKKEFFSSCRLVQKQLHRHQPHVPAPTFAPREVGLAAPFTGPLTTVGMNRPGFMGAHLAFVWGQHPVYTVGLAGLERIPVLRWPLEPFPEPLSRASRIKKNTIMCRPIVAVINRLRTKTTEVFEGVPARAALDMLTPSPGPDHNAATLYNGVITVDEEGHAEARITSLKNTDPRSRRSRFIRILNWFLAKHVIESGYHPGSVFACELWTYLDEDGLVLCFNRNSGTYMPGEDRALALADFLPGFFGVRVRYVPL